MHTRQVKIKSRAPADPRVLLKGLAYTTARLKTQLDRLEVSNGRCVWSGRTFRTAEDPDLTVVTR
jgi:hypothetical protein